MSLKPVDLVLFEQKFNTARQFANGLCLFGMHLVQIEGDALKINPELGKRSRLRFVKDFGRVQQRLRRNTPDVQARAAQGFPTFNASSLQSELCSTDCGNIAARTCTNNDQVVIMFCHGSGSLKVDQQPGRVFNRLFDDFQESNGLAAVDKAMVIA